MTYRLSRNGLFTQTFAPSLRAARTTIKAWKQTDLAMGRKRMAYGIYQDHGAGLLTLKAKVWHGYKPMRKHAKP